MSRKSLFLCLALLAAMVAGIGVAVAFLYSDSEPSGSDVTSVADESRYLLLPAVPSDAVAVFCFSEAEDCFEGAFSKEVVAACEDEKLLVSLHHSGKQLIPLYVVDAGRASAGLSQTGRAVYQAAIANGMYADTLSCATLDGVKRGIANRYLVLASKHENLVKSSVRHLQSGESVMDASGFASASAAVTGDNVVFLAGNQAQRIISEVMASGYRTYSAFFSRLAQWTAFSVPDGFRFSGAASLAEGKTEFMKVLEESIPEVSSLSKVLPAYTVFAASLPMKDVNAYLDAYKDFVDSRQQLAAYNAKQKELSAVYGRKVEDLIRISGIKEMAAATFKVAGSLQKVNMMRIDRSALEVFCPEAASRDYVPAAHSYSFQGFASSLFGKFFSLSDESVCTYVNGWLISGSRAAIGEYVENNALEYTLADKMKDSGKADLLAQEPSVFVSYFSLSEDKDALSGVFAKNFLPYVQSLLEGNDYCPFVLRVAKGKKNTELHAELLRTAVKRSKAPAVDRDTTVVVPEGPYMVKNSGTGKMNKFYQNSHMSICLNEEGKDLWGIPFQDRICGVAETVDFYANGKLQILFGAGSKMYLIDRLGRFVSGFPVDLGKEILIGPKPYDFNGVKRYNVLVLHKDNTIEMYGMKGNKPDSWKGIKAQETIKGLPEMLSAGNRTYWVVRTSVQTLIFPFNGGTPLTQFEGDSMIRPDSPVRLLEDMTVEVECYDGRNRTVKL